MNDQRWWPPAVILLIGAVLATVGVRAQRTLPLRQELGTAVPGQIEGFQGRDVRLRDDEVQVAGVSDYLARSFVNPDTTSGARGFALYVGYYDRQSRGKTIHSPRNCLPGAGWEPLTNSVAQVATAGGTVPVNRYLLQKGNDRALVLYWYQGRGRVAANEYLVKWDLLRDAALRRRSDEALVRIVVPIRSSEAEAFGLASRIAQQLIGVLGEALPAA